MLIYIYLMPVLIKANQTSDDFLKYHRFMDYYLYKKGRTRFFLLSRP